MRLHRSPWLALLATGCWLTPAEVTRKIERVADTEDTEDTDVPGPLDITEIEPAFGPSGGGTVVTLRASPLGDEAEVLFDGVAGEVTSLTGGTIVVVTPPGTEGPADVEVTSGVKSGEVGQGFRYWKDGSGKFGAVGTIEHFKYEGEYADWIGLQTAAFADLDLIQPIPQGFDALYGQSMDSCRSGVPTIEVEGYDTGASEVTLTRRPSTSFALDWDAESDRFRAELTEGEYATFATYDLEPIDGNAAWPSFGVDGIARTPGPFTVVNPNIYNGSPFIVAGPRLQWSTDHQGDFMVARLLRWESGDVVEEVRCLMTDDGDFTVPASVWSDWNSLEYVDIFLGRVLTSNATLPHNGARSAVVGVYWVVGSTVAL